MDIPVVVVTLNRSADIEAWLGSVAKLAEGKHNVHAVPFVVDNGSSDPTVGRLADAVRASSLERENVVWLPRNYGFTAAQNIALRKIVAHTDYKYVATLNLDATAEPSWLADLVANAEDGPNPKAAMWASNIYQPNRSGWISSRGHRFSPENGKCYDIDWNVREGEAQSSAAEFEPFGPCFAASMWTTETLRCVGLPDNDQFMYYDDIDLAFKARLHGKVCQFAKEAVAYHPLPGSTSSYGAFAHQQREGQLCIVSRYFPEPERGRILANLSAEDRAVLNMIPNSRLAQVGKESARRALFDEWKDRNTRKK